MMLRPSDLIISYNRERVIRETLRSALDQGGDIGEASNGPLDRLGSL